MPIFVPDAAQMTAASTDTSTQDPGDLHNVSPLASPMALEFSAEARQQGKCSTSSRGWSAATDKWCRREWAAAYQTTAAVPEGYWLPVQGQLPPDLEGTYFRNGPGAFEVGKQPVAHPFDGQGLVTSIAIRNGKAFFRSRFVQTAECVEERRQQRLLFRGTFGTQQPAPLAHLLDLMPKNVANTNVLLWGGHCLALFEAGQPYRLHPSTLETCGQDLLGKLLRPGVPFTLGSAAADAAAGKLLGLLGIGKHLPYGVQLGGDAVTAHPHVDAATGRLVLFSYRLRLGGGSSWAGGEGGLVTEVTFREMDEDMCQVASVEHTLPGYAFLHDFAVTRRHYVLFQNPVRLRLGPLLSGSLAPAHCVDWRSGGALRAHLVPRPLPAGASAAGAAAAAPRATAGQRQQPPTGEGAAARAAPGREQQAGAWSCGAAAPAGAQQQQAPAAEEGGVARQAPGAGQPQLAASLLQGEAAFVFHVANAWEDEAGTVVADVVRYPRMPDFKQASSGGRIFTQHVDPELQPISQLWRYTLHGGRAEAAPLCQRALEYPSVNPAYAGRRHRFVYAGAALHPTLNRPQQALAKLDTRAGTCQLWTRGLQYYVGEPQFVPRRCPAGQPAAAEDHGWLLAMCYDAAAAATELVVLDAARLEAGPLAVLQLRDSVPHGLHGSWAEQYCGPE